MSALLESIVGGQDIPLQSATGNVKAFAWARVSTDMQEEKGLSLPEQLREIRAYAEKNGIEIVEEFSEAASAFQKKSRRPEFERMLEKAKLDKEVSAIIVHDLSRFGRDSLDAQINRRSLRDAGVSVISISDPNVDPESVAGVYMEHILLAKNEAYSREIAFHTKKGCRANIQTPDPETGWCYKNGGQPLWGYRSERLVRGEIKKGRPLIKSIWVLDDKVVAGKPVHEWVRHCLVEMAAKGASLDELRDFCNKKGIPAPRKQYWGHTTWNSLLHTHCLLEYAGYGVWNVRGKSQRYNPTSEWVIVPNAHEALITEEEAQIIIESRKSKKAKRFDSGYQRSKNSAYLLSGGLFVCGRCGSNLLGLRKTPTASYYICGSQPHRRGMGCGNAVYVPQEQIEREVIAGLNELLDVCGDPKKYVREFNQEIRRLWDSSVGHDPSISFRLKEVESKIGNIRKAVEDGLPDNEWAYSRMRELMEERESLSRRVEVTGEVPQIDVGKIMRYRKEVEYTLTAGTNAEKKRLIRQCVDKITIAPDQLEVQINYRLPEAIGEYSGSGGWI